MSTLSAVVVCAVVAGGLGALVPAWLARLPEPPPPEQVQEADGAPGTVLDAPPPKQPYAEIAALPWFRPVAVGVSAVVAGLFALALGWTGALVYLVPLVPVGVMLFVVDARTTLLPTRVLHPTYAAMLLLVPLAALLDRDADSLLRAGIGWLVVGGWFWICWRLLGAWGFGDVRLSRVLGPALGYLGWSEMVIGLLLMLVVGALGGVALTLRHRSMRRRFPYGPFMLIGAALAVVLAPDLARALGYPPL